MTRTNLEKWQYYCDTIKSPDIFIEAGFYAMIGAALQRKVWRGSERKPLFGNTFTFLVADPGVGKGLVIDEVEKVFKHPRMQMTDAELSQDRLYGSLHRQRGQKNGCVEMPQLVHTGPRSCSYEMMVFQMASNTRSQIYAAPDNPDKKRLYMHSSVTFCLQELGSLFRKHTEDLVTFLCEAYDCGDYDRPTFERTNDGIRNCCLNLLAGATPEFLKRTLNDSLLSEGFGSRTLYIFADKNRFNRLRPPEFSEDQIKAHGEVVEHVREVSKLFGEVKFSEEASAYLEDWSLNKKIINFNPRLKGFQSRKDVNVQKIAMDIHFGESLEMEVGIESCRRAIDFMERIEKDMHMCFISAGAANPLADVTDNVLKFIKEKGSATVPQILLQFHKDLPQGRKSLEDIMSYLMTTKQTKIEQNKIVKYDK